MRNYFGLPNALVLFLVLTFSVDASAQSKARSSTGGPESDFSTLVGSPGDKTAMISVLSAKSAQGRIEYGTVAAGMNQKTEPFALVAGVPLHIDISGLSPNTQYVYRVMLNEAKDAQWRPQPSGSFRTARTPGQSFTFTVQGDSHPERPGRMYDPDLYVRALTNVAEETPDFHFMMGDDFSIERLIEQGNKSQNAVNSVYDSQRSYLGIVGKCTPLMLVNGNHEQAAKYLLDDTANNFAVLAGKARTNYFPLPAPGGIYTGNSKSVEHIGLLRDYYAWEWGDALFVVIDPYWHSDMAVDNEAGKKAPQRYSGRGSGGAGGSGVGDREVGAAQSGENKRDAKRRARKSEADGEQADQPASRQGKGDRDLWQITLGDDQYAWLRATLTQSKAKFKFVFSHHVSGTGRGGVEVAPFYEWGGQDRRGSGGNGGGPRQGSANGAPQAEPSASTPRGLTRFFQARPKWEQPIHDLMRDTGVTIFFQGHDHLYARQELDGVIYQSCPNPADPTFTAFNRESYKSGDIFPNSGHLRVSVTGGADATCKLEYVRAARPEDEAAQGKNGSIVHEYVVKPRAVKAPAVLSQKAQPSR